MNIFIIINIVIFLIHPGFGRECYKGVKYEVDGKVTTIPSTVQTCPSDRTFCIHAIGSFIISGKEYTVEKLGVCGTSAEAAGQNPFYLSIMLSLVDTDLVIDSKEAETGSIAVNYKKRCERDLCNLDSFVDPPTTPAPTESSSRNNSKLELNFILIAFMLSIIVLF